MPSDRAKNYLPKHIHVSRGPGWTVPPAPSRTDALLDTLTKPDDIGSWENGEYWHIAVPQALFDQLGHYSKADVRRVCLAWLLFNASESDLSPSVVAELIDLLKVQERLEFVDGAYSFVPSPPAQPAPPA